MSKERVLDAESIRTMYTLYSTFIVPDLGQRHTAMLKQHSLFHYDQSLKARTIGSIILARRRTWSGKRRPRNCVYVHITFELRRLKPKADATATGFGFGVDFQLTFEFTVVCQRQYRASNQTSVQKRYTIVFDFKLSRTTHTFVTSLATKFNSGACAPQSLVHLYLSTQIDA